jgi:hypothetical protein
MSIPKQLGAAAVLTALSFTAAPAQQVMSEPAYCAFFYPNANCQNKGPGNPYTDPNYRRYGGQSSGPWPSGETVGVAPKRAAVRHNNVSALTGEERARSHP